MKEDVGPIMLLFSIIHFPISKIKSVWHPVYGIFVSWQNHFSTRGLRLKSVNGGPSPQTLMRLLKVLGFIQLWTSDFILLFALIVLSNVH